MLWRPHPGDLREGLRRICCPHIWHLPHHFQTFLQRPRGQVRLSHQTTSQQPSSSLRLADTEGNENCISKPIASSYSRTKTFRVASVSFICTVYFLLHVISHRARVNTLSTPIFISLCIPLSRACRVSIHTHRESPHWPGYRLGWMSVSKGEDEDAGCEGKRQDLMIVRREDEEIRLASTMYTEAGGTLRTDSHFAFPRQYGLDRMIIDAPGNDSLSSAGSIYAGIVIRFDIGFCVGGQLVTCGYFALDSSRILAHPQCLDLLLPEL